jgi:hypothetical protein
VHTREIQPAGQACKRTPLRLRETRQGLNSRLLFEETYGAGEATDQHLFRTVS